MEFLLKWPPFIIRTDRRSLKFFVEQRVSTLLQQKWSNRMLGYGFEIVYRKGEDNNVADALSRVQFAGGKLTATTVATPSWPVELHASYKGVHVVEELLEKGGEGEGEELGIKKELHHSTLVVTPVLRQLLLGSNNTITGLQTGG